MEKFNQANPNMDLAIFTDTEAETSMEPDAEEKLHTMASIATSNAAKSLFNITFDDFEDEEKHESVELKDYEAKLGQELKEWKSIIHNAYKDLKKSKQKHPTVDKTILPPEKREYLEKAPSLDNFIRGSLEFREEAHIFLELDYAEVLEALQNLESLCKHHLETIKAQKLAENLANYRKS